MGGMEVAVLTGKSEHVATLFSSLNMEVLYALMGIFYSICEDFFNMEKNEVANAHTDTQT